jgi:hypothetical protein
MVVALPEGKKQAMQGRCGDEACGWVWTVCYLPMPIETASKIMRRAICPACGHDKVLCA